MRAVSLVLFLGMSLAVACGDAETGTPTTTTTTTGTGGLDTHVYPEPNGVQITETEACDRMRAVIDTSSCVFTGSKCPDFIRVIEGHDPDCVMYDEGSVEGCVAFFESLSCQELQARQRDCVATVYPGTEPAGCP